MPIRRFAEEAVRYLHVRRYERLGLHVHNISAHTEALVESHAAPMAQQISEMRSVCDAVKADARQALDAVAQVLTRKSALNAESERWRESETERMGVCPRA